MKDSRLSAEQACRAVTDEAGWKISARSPGFTARNAANLGNAFNDSMNRIFRKMGQSIFSCKKSGGDVFFGMATMHSESHGRPYIFTNARVISRDRYEKIMAAAPEMLLGMTADEFLTQNPDTGRLAAASFCGRRVTREETAKKYALGRDAEAELFFDAYEALTRGKRLAFDADIAEGDTGQALILIEDMVSLAVCGLPPGMRGQVTWSSGADPACRFFAAAKEDAGRAASGRGVIHFKINPRERKPFDAAPRGVKNNRDLLRRMCAGLAAMLPEERADVLAYVDRCCHQIAAGRPAYTGSVILSSYYMYLMARGRKTEVTGALFLILLLLGDLKSGVIDHPRKVPANTWLAKWLTCVADAGLCPNAAIMREVLERAFDENEAFYMKPDSGLYAAAMRALSFGSKKGRLALADAIARGKDTELRRKTAQALREI